VSRKTLGFGSVAIQLAGYLVADAPAFFEQLFFRNAGLLKRLLDSREGVEESPSSGYQLNTVFQHLHGYGVADLEAEFATYFGGQCDLTPLSQGHVSDV